MRTESQIHKIVGRREVDGACFNRVGELLNLPNAFLTPFSTDRISEIIE
jgi:hypothetical protein